MELAGDVEHLIPGHDPKIRRHYPSCRVEGVELIALHEKPRGMDATELGRLDDF
ncbi:hypothetical protein D3C76_1819900 [compost metagenome]